MPVTLRATSELVAVAWLNGLFDTDMVATTLPKADSDGNLSWAASGFVTVATVGGAAHQYNALRQPVVSVDCWAANPNSARPPWGKAANLAEEIQAGCYATDIGRALTLPTGYPGARVLSAYAVSEARRVPADPASYARYNLALALHWIEVPS